MALPQYLKTYIIFTIERLYSASILFNLPKLSAIFLVVLVKKNAGNKATSDHNRVLCLGRSIFTDDIQALVNYSGRINYYIFSKSYLGLIVRKYIQSPSLSESNYYTDKAFSDGKKKVYLFMKTFFLELRKLLKFNAVLVCNFGYIDQQEFLRVAREYSIPVIVLYKEGMASEAGLKKIMESYATKKIQCDLFLCYNEKIKTAFLEYSVQGINEKKIFPVGVPRLDCYTRSKDSTEKKIKQLIFFSFFPDDKFLRYVDDITLMEELRERAKCFHSLVIRYALDNKSINVIIKTKSAKHYLDYVYTIAEDTLKERVLPSNLHIINHGMASDLISNSFCVLGSHSTVLLEALLANKPVICPAFSDILASNGLDIISENTSSVSYVSNYDEFTELVTSYSSSDGIMRRSKSEEEFLLKYLFDIEGGASSRTESYILGGINSAGTT